MANTEYPKATGGTPITSWLVNQIEACLQYQSDICDALNSFGSFGAGDVVSATGEEAEGVITAHQSLSSTLEQKKGLLVRQVQYLNEQQHYNVELLYSWNQEFNLADDPELRA